MVFILKRFPFRVMLILVFSLIGSKLGAQVDIETDQPEQAGIFLNGNATVHSSDEIFNAQIESKKIKIRNDQKNLLSITRAGSKIIIKTQPRQKNFSEEVKIAQKKKTDEIKKSVDKKINATLSKVKSNFRDLIKSHSSEQLAHQGGSLKQNFIVPSPTHDSQKIIAEKQFILLIRSLNDLQEKKIFDYNNQSKNFGFTKVLSVRPPPFLC